MFFQPQTETITWTAVTLRDSFLFKMNAMSLKRKLSGKGATGASDTGKQESKKKDKGKSEAEDGTPATLISHPS